MDPIDDGIPRFLAPRLAVAGWAWTVEMSGPRLGAPPSLHSCGVRNVGMMPPTTTSPAPYCYPGTGQAAKAARTGGSRAGRAANVPNSRSQAVVWPRPREIRDRRPQR